MSDLILGIDIGTTSVKLAVYDHAGIQMASTVEEYALLTPDSVTVEAPCRIYMDSIKKSMDAIARSGAIDTRRITAIGFSVQSETLCLLDGAGDPLCNAIVWMDRRAGSQAEELRARFGDELCYQVTGQVSFEACWPAAKLLWVREHDPELFSKVRHFLLLEDYIIYLLTGQFVTEGSLLTSTEYWDIRSKEYWDDMLAFLGVKKEYLPQIRESGEVVGRILPEMAGLLGVSPNAQVCTGCMDQAAAAIGVGNIRPGIFSENIGACLAVCVPTAKLVYDGCRQIPVHYFAIPDTYMMHTFTTGGMCLRWFRDQFCQAEMSVQDQTGLDSYYLMDCEAASVAPGSGGLIALPHLQGAMAPDVNLNAKAVFYGATLEHGKAHFIRSIMESLGYIICRNLDAVASMGLEVRQIRSMGGGAKSDVWNQIKADITGKTLYVTESSQDIACLGAAILAGVATGVFQDIITAADSMVRIKRSYTPNMELHAVYAEQYKKYNLLFRSLEGLFQLDAAAGQTFTS